MIWHVVTCLVVGWSLLAADGIAGVWKSINDETGYAQCIVVTYEYQGKWFGRIIATCNREGHINDSIYEPKERAPGVAGEPYYAGLDLIWNLRSRGTKYKGKIIDPEKGGIYNAEVWRENGKLIVRGTLFIFGRSVTWEPAVAADFPETFHLPNVADFVPVIPASN